MPIQVTCSTCYGQFNAPDDAAGKKAKCPRCGGAIEIPQPLAAAHEVVDAEVTPERPFEDERFSAESTTAPAALSTGIERRPCPKCGEMIAQAAVKCRFCGEVFDPMLRNYQRTTARTDLDGTGNSPLFLYISITRLIVMSILTFGLYEAYWIYKNWRFLKDRDHLSIWPVARGIFSIFFCHSLFRHIHEDPEARAVETPTFSASGFATGWVALRILSSLFSRAPGLGPLLISIFMPSYLCLVPVQKYINSVTERRTPGVRYYRWSNGHIICLIIGLILWFFTIVAIVAYCLGYIHDLN